MSGHTVEPLQYADERLGALGPLSRVAKAARYFIRQNRSHAISWAARGGLKRMRARFEALNRSEAHYDLTNKFREAWLRKVDRLRSAPRLLPDGLPLVCIRRGHLVKHPMLTRGQLFMEEERLLSMIFAERAKAFSRELIR